MFVEILLFVIVISYVFYKWATSKNDYFERRNIKYMKPKFLVGNNEGNITATEFATKVYQSFPDEA